MRHLHERALQSEKDRVILDEALGHAYEGLVITDVGMPGISGMDLLSSVKELATTGDPAPTDVYPIMS